MTTAARFGQDPAASAYGDLMRARRSGIDPIAREAERVRTLMASYGVPVTTPAQATEREIRRAMIERFRL